MYKERKISNAEPRGSESPAKKSTLIPINEFEKNNKDFQKFKKDRKRSMRVELANEFQNRHHINGTNTSYVSERVAPVSTKALNATEVRHTSNTRDENIRNFQRSIPKGLQDSQTSFNMTSNASYAQRQERANINEENRSYNTSKRTNKVENEDEVNYTEEAFNSEEPESTYPKPINKEGKVRRNRNMRGDKSEPQSYTSNRFVSNLYSKPKVAKKLDS